MLQGSCLIRQHSPEAETPFDLAALYPDMTLQSQTHRLALPQLCKAVLPLLAACVGPTFFVDVLLPVRRLPADFRFAVLADAVPRRLSTDDTVSFLHVSMGLTHRYLLRGHRSPAMRRLVRTMPGHRSGRTGPIDRTYVVDAAESPWFQLSQA
jgi:hypothetical protein